MSETRRLFLYLFGGLVAAIVLLVATYRVAGLSADNVVMWLFLAAALAVNIYLPLFTFRPWWDSSVGRALWIKALGNVIVIDMSVLYLAFGDYPFRDELRIIGMCVFNVGVWYLLLTLLRTPSRSYPWSRHRQGPDEMTPSDRTPAPRR